MNMLFYRFSFFGFVYIYCFQIIIFFNLHLHSQYKAPAPHTHLLLNPLSSYHLSPSALHTQKPFKFDSVVVVLIWLWFFLLKTNGLHPSLPCVPRSCRSPPRRTQFTLIIPTSDIHIPTVLKRSHVSTQQTTYKTGHGKAASVRQPLLLRATLFSLTEILTDQSSCY